MNKQKFFYLLKLLFILVLIFWVLISLARTVYNFSKVYTEELSWLKLTDTQKRQRIFGKRYDFLQLVKDKTSENSKILFIFNEKGKLQGSNYLAFYNLYPRKLEILVKGDDLSDFKNYDYIVEVNTKESLLGRNNGEYDSFYQMVSFTGDNFDANIFKHE